MLEKRFEQAAMTLLTLMIVSSYAHSLAVLAGLI